MKYYVEISLRKFGIESRLYYAYKVISKCIKNGLRAPLKIAHSDIMTGKELEKKMSQPGIFDLDNRYQKLNEKDPLINLNELID